MAEAKIIKKLRELHERSKAYPHLILDRNLYKILCDREIYLLAYQKLRSNPGNMTQGSTPETLDGMSTKLIDSLIEKLEDESFQFSAGRRVSIPKKSGGTRPLTMASPRDKLVQEAMRLILEAIWEPIFSDNSHGFRPNRGCHTALKQIKDQFKSSV
jgi:retron-type reverse transcriptase